MTLVIGGLLAGLLLSEAAYRIARNFVCIGPAPLIFELRSWGWMHVPNKAVWVYACAGRRFEYQTYLTINSQGLRDHEYLYEKRAGTRRVLLLGDSMTEAVQVPLERTFAKLVEERVRVRGAAVDVINGGQAGFATDSELLFYREEGRRYASDLVVLMFNFQNDILENSPTLYRRAYEHAEARFPPKPSFSLGADGTLQQRPVSSADIATMQTPDQTMWQRISSKLYLLRMVERALSSSPPAPPSFVPPLNYEIYTSWNADWQEAWQLTMRLTQELRAVVQESGARFAVALLPARELVAPDTFERSLGFFQVKLPAWDLERPHRAMTDFLRAEGIPFVDLLPVLQAHAATGRQDFYGWDVHMNEGGHATITPPLAAFIQDQLDAR
jgi:hypothetical protein